MEIDTLLEALKDFEKKGKKEVSLVLDQFLCHVAKTGETMVSWSQFKGYFMFKLEMVMEDFQASAPDQRGPVNPNIESVPFEEMKDRILKIVNGYNGIPFTIQRLCELLTDPKRNYTGTEKFLRGVEKNVMVVSCVYPTSEKNGCSSVNRMNGVMLPGSSSIFTERKVNGPGTPRPVNRLKISPSSALATNGLLDSTENKDSNTTLSHSKPVCDVPVSGPGSPLNSCIKNKHDDEEENPDEEQEVKRLKFSEEEEDTKHDSEDKTAHSEGMFDESKNADSPSSMTPEEIEGSENEQEAARSTAPCEDQEPSSTQSDCAEREVPSSSAQEPCDMDQSEQTAPASSPESLEEESSEPDSSSGNEPAVGLATLSDSTPSSADLPTDSSVESGELDLNTEEPMEQD